MVLEYTMNSMSNGINSDATCTVQNSPVEMEVNT